MSHTIGGFSIAISGKMTSGKTTLMQYLRDHYGLVHYCFAQPLKDMEAIHVSCPPEMWREALYPIVTRAVMFLAEYSSCPPAPPTSDELMGRIIETFCAIPPTPGQKNRKLLQYLGTQVGRYLHPDIWIAYLLGSIKHSDHKSVVVDDMRFRNEFYALKAAGFVTVRLSIPEDLMRERVRLIYGPDADSPERYTHISEIELDGLEAEFDYVIDTSGPVEALYREADYIVQEVSGSMDHHDIGKEVV